MSECAFQPEKRRERKEQEWRSKVIRDDTLFGDRRHEERRERSREQAEDVSDYQADMGLEKSSFLRSRVGEDWRNMTVKNEAGITELGVA